MKKISLVSLLLQAEKYCDLNKPWHHHYLPPQCLFNKQKEFRIILENEDGGEVFYAIAATKPSRSLEKLERLFFRQK